MQPPAPLMLPGWVIIHSKINMFWLKKAKTKLNTPRHRTGQKIRDKTIGDVVWITEDKTGLLVKSTIVHEFHVPGQYSEAVKKYEKNPNNIVWAKQELGGSRFRWVALYADAEVEEVVDNISGDDIYLNHYKVQTLYSEPDNTSRS